MVTTKTQALESYRHLMEDRDISMADFFEAMGLTRQTQYNWPEEMNRHQCDKINGFLLRLESEQ